MINGRRVIAIIPARGGSKGLPGKNIRMLCGKPLIAWSIEKALKSRCLDTVLVSTDSAEIADVARSFGAEVPFLRPAELATDHASTYEVIRHALADCARRGQQFEYTVLLEPTSPLREDDDIDRMLDRLDRGSADFDSIVSVGEVMHHPAIMKRLSGERLDPFVAELSAATRRQDNAPAYFPFGVAYMAKSAALLEHNTFYMPRCLAFPLRRYQNYEIDDLYDWLCVQAVMRHEWRLP